ncbi:hypothetical protein P691DRAFT_173364 [Macrolepiota fuliginosa MF-IS2]|uniref:Uncharacterized protein n=1 Tax=Macrolepiota fuliginosa MF-IS2 TaxID=1400762 RepID=A0A9P5XB23_9AGAR|nr:hypothetical protein P691DRAFT_173364 [Macrolepiota fuliginosa MF-IS2]
MTNGGLAGWESHPLCLCLPLLPEPESFSLAAYFLSVHLIRTYQFHLEALASIQPHQMVAPSLSPTAKTPSLSYAERAKKAQNIRSPIGVNQPQPSRISQPPPPPISVASSLSSASGSSAKSTSAARPPSSSPAFVHASTSQPQTPNATAVSESKITIINGNSNLPSSSTSKPALASVIEPQFSPQKQSPVNVWDRRKEELAARNAPQPKPTTTALQSSTSISRSTTNASTSASHLSQNDSPSHVAETKQPLSTSHPADDDDPFIVRQSRAPRPQAPVTPPTLLTENVEDWPEVGKTVPAPAAPAAANSTEVSKSDEPQATNGETAQTGAARKSGSHKWIPLPLQPPPEVQQQSRRDSQSMRGNRSSANASRATSIPGQGRNSRTQSGRNSTSQSVNVSRIHSNAGSVHSSPRNPRSKRLPGEEVLAGGANAPTNGSRTSSPLHVNPSQSSFPPVDTVNHPSSYGGYLSPPNGPSPYYPSQPPSLPPISSPAYHSPSHGAPLGLQPDPSLPMPTPAHGYQYVYPSPYIPYEYIPSSAPYPYWNGHHSHPGSGQHSPAYPPSATPSSYTAALPHHIQQHFYPLPQVQPQHSVQSSVSGAPPTCSTSEHGSVSDSDAAGAAPNVAVPSSVDTELRANGDIRRSASVVFGSIDVAAPAESADATVGIDAKDNLEKMFKSLAIGLDPADSVVKTRKSTKFSKGGESLREEGKVVNGEIAVDPALAKEIEAGSAGETKWKFGNEGFASPAGGVVIDMHATTLDVSGVLFCSFSFFDLW